MNYFSNFPTTLHDLKDTNVKTELTNILRRFKVRPKAKDTVATYYDYIMQEGDRPDTIAAKYYGNEKLAWLILLFNDIIDPFYDLPLYGQNFPDYIKVKYGSVQTANATVKHYYKILEEEKLLIDGTRLPRREVICDLATYNSLAGTPTLRRSETVYEWEEKLNEDKKKLKLLDKRYVPTLLKEIASVLR